MAQIAGQRLADFLRNRQAICAHPGAPNADLSRRPVAATDGRFPFATRQEALEFVRRQCARQRGHRPIRHRRHAQAQVDLDESTVTRELKQGTQCRGHQLGALCMMKSSRFPLNEAHDIRRPHPIKPDFALPAVLIEKAPGKPQIAQHRCRSQPPLLFQITLEFPFQPPGRRRLDGRCLGHHALFDEQRQQPSQDRRITGSEVTASRSVPQICDG